MYYVYITLNQATAIALLQKKKKFNNNNNKIKLEKKVRAIAAVVW